MTNAGLPDWAAWLTCVAFGGVVTLGYGMLFGPALARRDPLVKAVATLGLTLILFGVMDLLWTTSGGQSRAITLPTEPSRVPSCQWPAVAPGLRPPVTAPAARSRLSRIRPRPISNSLL
jgi:branched-subunit amino acid ABC-type transport system permease component